MAKEAFLPSSRWGVPALLAGMLLASTVPACFGLTADDYNNDAGKALGASGKGGSSTTTSAGGSAGSETAGSPGSAGSVGSAGNVGSAGSPASAGSNGNGGSVANGGSAGNGGNGGAGGAGGGGQGGAGGQAGAMPVCPAKPADGAGTGLKGEYFATQDLTGAVALTRTDPKVDFNWVLGSPDPAIPIDHFSVRWTGQLQPRYTGSYTFATQSDDGSRMFVNGKTVVDSFIDQNGMAETPGTPIDLVAGMKYPIKVEYFDNSANALVQVRWSSACQAKEIIPTTQLFPQ